MLDRKFMDKMAMKVRKRYVEHIFLKGKDVNDKKFKPYDKTPASKLYGERKRANKFKRQSSAFKNTTSPVLTGDFMNDCKPYSTNNSFGIIWAAYGSRVKHLADRDRKVTTKAQPFPEPILKMIGIDINKEVKRKLPKSKTTRIKIGK
jgi:hypothetical protein